MSDIGVLRWGLEDAASAVVTASGVWCALYILSNFTSLLTLASGLNEIGFIHWVAEGFAKPLVGMSPTLALIVLVTLFFFHYFFSSITSHAAAVLPLVLAVID